SPLAVAAGDRGDAVFLPAGTVAHDDAPFGGLVEAGDAVEDGRLAGAVGADQRGDVAAPDIEGKIVDGDEAAEPHGQMLDRQDGVLDPASGRRAARRRVLHARVHQCPSPWLTRSAPIFFFSLRT